MFFALNQYAVTMPPAAYASLEIQAFRSLPQKQGNFYHVSTGTPSCLTSNFHDTKLNSRVIIQKWQRIFVLARKRKLKLINKCILLRVIDRIHSESISCWFDIRGVELRCNNLLRKHAAVYKVKTPGSYSEAVRSYILHTHICSLF